METMYSRTELIIGKDKMEYLKNRRVAIFGIGGVGGYTVEALARCGIGAFELIDKDEVSASNINRQIIALNSTVGRSKTAVMRERILDINQAADVSIIQCFFLPENSHEFDFKKYDYIVDAVDTVTAKLEIVKMAVKYNIPLISSMGMGNKLNPLDIKVSDIYETKNCPLARVMRRELKKLGIDRLKTVYSQELPDERNFVRDEVRRAVPGSISFVPSAAGLLIASEVIKDLCDIMND